MTYRLHLQIQTLPKCINETAGLVWQVKHQEARKWLLYIADAIVVQKQRKPSKALTKAKVTLVRHSSGTPDYDGIVSGFKPIIDALVKLEIIADDSMQVIGAPEYRHERTTPRKGYVSITVEGISG